VTKTQTPAANEPTASAEDIIGGSESALILLDVENRFFWQTQHGPELPAASLLPNLKQLLDVARARGVLRVVVSTILDEKADSDSWRRRRTHLRASMPWLYQHTEWSSQVAAPLVPRPDEIALKKLRPSAFYGTSLDIYLRSRGVRALVLAGLATNGAVLATFMDATSRDLHAFVVRDGVQGTSPQLHEAALSIIASSNLLDTEAVCRAWQV
jgi:ureidoacrylate peracid hydrolase